MYLREEVQAEALVRNLPGFARFLPIAALFHGQTLNAAALARDAEVSRSTVASPVCGGGSSCTAEAVAGSCRMGSRSGRSGASSRRWRRRRSGGEWRACAGRPARAPRWRAARGPGPLPSTARCTLRPRAGTPP
jgi:hypothetical protein